MAVNSCVRRIHRKRSIRAFCVSTIDRLIKLSNREVWHIFQEKFQISIWNSDFWLVTKLNMKISLVANFLSVCIILRILWVISMVHLSYGSLSFELSQFSLSSKIQSWCLLIHIQTIHVEPERNSLTTTKLNLHQINQLALENK